MDLLAFQFTSRLNPWKPISILRKKALTAKSNLTTTKKVAITGCTADEYCLSKDFTLTKGLEFKCTPMAYPDF
jgi:hypothetical protein